MPRYDLRCAACGESWEQTLGMRDQVPACGRCGSPLVERLITAAPAAHFKGSGFYETDYKKRNPERPSVIERF